MSCRQSDSMMWWNVMWAKWLDIPAISGIAYITLSPFSSFNKLSFCMEYGDRTLSSPLSLLYMHITRLCCFAGTLNQSARHKLPDTMCALCCSTHTWILSEVFIIFKSLMWCGYLMSHVQPLGEAHFYICNEKCDCKFALFSGSQSVLTYATVYGTIVGWDLRAPEVAWKLENGPRKG